MLVPPAQRNLLVTTSRGTGELILSALDKGAQHHYRYRRERNQQDVGRGKMQALGAKFTDANGTEIGYGGGSLMALNRIDISDLIRVFRDAQSASPVT